MKEIEKLLARIKSGETTIEEGMEELKFLPVKSLHHTLIDTHRELRNGFTEVIYGEGKSTEQMIEIINALMLINVPALLSAIELSVK